MLSYGIKATSPMALTINGKHFKEPHNHSHTLDGTDPTYNWYVDPFEVD